MRTDLRIASPCTADWNHMVGDDRIRHCAECNLNVYNFAAMTSAEVEELVSGRAGRLCARLYQRQDGTILTKDCPIGFQVKIRRISRVAGIALAAATAGMNLAVAQNSSVQTPSQLVQIQKKETGITVHILDQAGAGVAKARISFKDMAGKKHSGTTGQDGNFSVSGLGPGEYKIKIRVPDNPSWYHKITVVRDEMVLVQMTAPATINVGVVLN